MIHFNVKFNITMKPRFKHLSLSCMPLFQVILNVYNIKKFIIATLHWKQPTLCDRSI